MSYSNYWGEARFADMLGKKLAFVECTAQGGAIAFVFDDGTRVEFYVEGDCCSHSWIEHLQLPADIKGATVLSVDDSAPITSDHDDHDDGGDIQVYNTSFKTDRGEIILEYRNSSNGYYGGLLVRRS